MRSLGHFIEHVEFCRVIVRMLEMLGELSRSATRSDLHFKRICLTAELRNRTVGGIRSKGR